MRNKFYKKAHANKFVLVIMAAVSFAFFLNISAVRVSAQATTDFQINILPNTSGGAGGGIPGGKGGRSHPISSFPILVPTGTSILFPIPFFTPIIFGTQSPTGTLIPLTSTILTPNSNQIDFFHSAPELQGVRIVFFDIFSFIMWMLLLLLLLLIALLVKRYLDEKYKERKRAELRHGEI